MAVFTVNLQQASGVGDVSLVGGGTLATLAVAAGRGPKGDGFTGGSYNSDTGIVTFTSNDGIGFSTDDLRGDLSEPGPIGDVTPSTGTFTSLSSTGDTVIGGNLIVEGTTTTVDSTTVAIADKNIELAKDATTAAEADGGGITLNGAAATITYSSGNDHWALNKGLNVSGDVSLSGTVDGRDVAADGSKLDGIETNADVTDTANVTAAGALMDSELTSEASVKALDQGVATTDSPDFAGLSVDTNTLFVDAPTDSVGINNASPSASLDVTGDAKVSGDLTVDTDTFYVDSANDRVGIGTSSPDATFHIDSGADANDGFDLRISEFRPNIVLEDLSNSAKDWQFFVDGDDLQIRHGDASTDTKLSSEVMRINSSGIVDILGGTVVLNGNTLNGIQVTIADDAVAELTFPNRRFGMLNVVEGGDDDIFPDQDSYFLGWVDFGDSDASETTIKGSVTQINSSSALTGTTGTDGDFTIGVAGTSGTLYLENRRGGTRTFNVTLL